MIGSFDGYQAGDGNPEFAYGDRLPGRVMGEIYNLQVQRQPVQTQASPLGTLALMFGQFLQRRFQG